MRHIVNIMLGRNAEHMVCGIQQYINKYGCEQEKHYFSSLLFVETEDTSFFYTTESSKVDDSSFISGIENLLRVETQKYFDVPKETQIDYLRGCFSSLYNQRITINDSGDSTKLHVCLFVPIYKEEYWKITQDLLSAIDSIPQEYNVDLFLLPYDLAYIIEKDEAKILPTKMAKYQEQTKDTINSILESKKRYNSLEHIILMQNCNGEGLSLNLNEDSFIRIVGEYSLLTISHYDEIFRPTVQDKNRPIYALGLSVLSFDKYYYVQYLLHQAYIHILDRENVTQEEVDVNRVSDRVQSILSKRVNVFSSFYKNYIEPQLLNKESQESIIANIRPQLDSTINELTNEFQTYINDENLSLPEKKATLAQLLGEDDELLSGYMFNKKQLVVDDCSREVLDFYVKENNALLATNKGNDDDIETREISEHAVLSAKTRQRQRMPSEMIDELKQLKVSIRESSNYIRSKSIELQDIDIQSRENIESQKRLTDAGFVFDGHTYLLQKGEIERPCEEDYKPIRNIDAKVDLRQYFTAIKDQGKLGACSSFAMVGIYEYILKKNKAKDSDLSEAFVYYNAKSRETNNSDDGTSLYKTIVALGTEGVCLEHLCPYDTGLAGIKPSDDANIDGKTRLVTKALNVRKDIEHIKSAVFQGYPVAISLKIYDSFSPKAGFITRPSQDEIDKGDYGNHAMIICGYSDEEKIFIVRNSWGTKFGDKGYCYIPYSYVVDFMNVANIITDISVTDIKVAGNDIKMTASFDLANSKIKAAILRNLIDEEKHLLISTNEMLQKCENSYNQLFQRLGNNTTRTTISEGAPKRIEFEKKQVGVRKENLQKERLEELRCFDKKTKWGRHWFACAWLMFVVFFVVLLWPCHLTPRLILFSWQSYSLYVAMFIGTILFSLWHWKRHRERMDLDADYQSRIEHCEKEIYNLNEELKIVKLKSHVAGMIIDSLAKLFRNLHSKYNGMRSYVGNLKTWREEECKDSIMSDSVQEPFLSIINNNCLNSYFEECKDQITKSIRLYEMFKNSYQVDEAKIVCFKNKLKKDLINELYNKLDGFSMYKHIVGEETYPFVGRDYTNIDILLQTMDRKSSHFVRTFDPIDTYQTQNVSCKLLFVDTDVETSRQKWDMLFKKNFQNKPSCYQGESHYKLTLLQMDCLAIKEIAILN